MKKQYTSPETTAVEITVERGLAATDPPQYGETGSAGGEISQDNINNW